jgi:acetoin utilization protein AcuB
MKKMPVLKTAMTPFPYSVDLNASFAEASELMGEHNVHHLPVTRDHEVVGVITDRDLASATHLQTQSSDSSSLTVRDLHIAEPYIVNLDEPLANVLLTMAKRHIDSAIVTRAGKLVGMFTTVDACRSFGEYLRAHFPRPTNDGVA